MAAPDRYVTVPELARTLRCSPETIRRMIRQDNLPAIQIGRSYRLPFRDVVDALATTRTSTGQRVASLSPPAARSRRSHLIRGSNRD